MKKRIFTGLMSVLLIMALSFTACASFGRNVFSSPGVFTATEEGFNGPVTVRAEFSAGRIVSVEVIEHSDTPAFAFLPVKRIPAEIVQFQSLAVDSVTGATITSMAILNATMDTARQAGGDISRLTVRPREPSRRPITINTDVLVVGSGISGMFAAFEARLAGAEVLVIETNGVIGGTSASSGGMIHAFGTEQMAAGNPNSVPPVPGVPNDTWQDFFDFIIDQGRGDLNRGMVEHIARTSLNTVRWMADMGVLFRPHIQPSFPGFVNNHRSLRTVGGTGSEMFFPMIAYAESLGIDIMIETRGLSLIQATPGGRVTGAIARNRAGAEVTINADSVILATGGMQWNPELLAEFFPIAIGILPAAPAGVKSNDGNGHIMALAAGAGRTHAINPSGFIQFVHNFGIWVTPDGNRFMDEAYFYHNARNDRLFRTGYNVMWTIMGNVPPQAGVTFGNRPATIAATSPVPPNTTPGAIFRADNLAALAAAIGIDAAVLAATVAAYNAQIAADNALPAAAFANPANRRLEFASRWAFNGQNRHVAINPNAEVWAVRSGPLAGVGRTHGGILVDIDGRVLNTAAVAQPIPGLFAVGDIANGDYKPSDYGGSGMALTVNANMARRVGRVAAGQTWTGYNTWTPRN